MEYILVETLDSNGDRSGKFENIIVERDMVSSTATKPIFKLENGDIVNCLNDEESEFELIKGNCAKRYFKV